jgi:hypothetical protein
VGELSVPLPGGLGGDLHGNCVESFVIAIGVTSDQGLHVIRRCHSPYPIKSSFSATLPFEGVAGVSVT